MSRVIIFTLPFLLIITGCKTGKVVIHDATTRATNYIERYAGYKLKPFEVFKKQGFRYEVPDGMAESPDEAIKFRYDNLIVDKEYDYFTSSLVIAIRHYNLGIYETFEDFTKMDQSYLQQSVKPVYESGWQPQGLCEKNIECKYYDFFYYMKKQKIYQRSVYVKSNNTIHIVSLSSIIKEMLSKTESERFWTTIEID